ncbi:MAG: alpha/beta hydrolase [Actinomycetota bacterium]|nr:alpha/beta hydrolase [Actinomycetota bacterium]
MTADDRPSLWSALREVAFTQSYVDAGGIRTRYVEAGPADAPAVVMLHGTGGHWETFARNLGPYSQHFRTIAFDMVGNGFTDRPDYDYEIPQYVAHVQATMNALGVQRAHLLGTSLGSWVAAAFALQHPERVHKLVFMSATGLVGTAENMARIRATRMNAVNDPEWSSIKAMFDHLLADEKDRLDDLVSLRQAIYRQPGMIQTMEHTLVLQDAEVRQRNLIPEADWRRITAPTLTIASGEDVSEYTNTSRQVAQLMPNATVFEMPAVKHWPHFENADLFNQVSLHFLLTPTPSPRT